MIEERPYLQVPLPSPEDYRAHEEWLKKKEEESEEDDHVIILEL